MSLVSIIVPVLNEAENLPALCERLSATSKAIGNHEFEFIFVDDGSTDLSMFIIGSLRKLDSRIKAVRFSRNFGSHAACLAGLSIARGEYAMFMAADLQDPPELVPAMLAKMEEGNDVVFAVRGDREDSWLKKKFANTYHRLMRRYAIPNWPAKGADVVMIRRSVRDVVIQWRQKNTSLFAQIMWSGFRQAQITYTKQHRRAGESKWTFGKKIKLFVDSFVSFSFTPIRLISLSGIGFSAIGFCYAIFIVLNKLFLSRPIEGWSSLMVALLVVSGFQLLMLGVIGEYLWRVADEVRGSPPFVVQAQLGIQPENPTDDEWSAATIQEGTTV